MEVLDEEDLHSTWSRSSQPDRSTLKVRTIIGIAAATVWLTSTGLADKYDDFVAKGYRWITTDGPFACRSKDDLQRLIKDQSDENRMRMVRKEACTT